MTEELQTEIREEIATIAEKYGIRDAAFCGVAADDDFCGFFIGKGTSLRAGQVFNTVLNIGRLWQFAREMSRKVLASFEK